MPAKVPKGTQQPSFSNPLYSMLAEILQNRMPGIRVEEVSPRRRGGRTRLEITPAYSTTTANYNAPQVNVGGGLTARRMQNEQVPGEPMFLEAQFGAPSPLGIRKPPEAGVEPGFVPLTNRSVIITTPSNQKYIMGAAGIGKWNAQANRAQWNWFAPVENLANTVLGALEMANKPDAGTPNQLLEWGMTHQAREHNIIGGAFYLSPNQRGTQAPGLLAKRISVLTDYERGVTGGFQTGEDLRKALFAGIESGLRGEPWQWLQNYMVYDRSGDTFRMRPAGEIEQYAQIGQPAVLSMLRGPEKRGGIKTSSSSGTRMNLTPMMWQRDMERDQTIFRPMTARAIMAGNNWANLPQYARLNATFGGEFDLESGDAGLKRPQERLTSIAMFAPTTFPGAAVMEPEAYQEVYGFKYEKEFRIPLGKQSLEELVKPETGLQLDERLYEGAMFKAGRRSYKTVATLGTTTNRAGETVPKPYRLPLRTSDFVVGADENAISLVIPALYRKQDFGGNKTGEATTEIYNELQQRFPGLNIETQADIEEPFLRIGGGYITGASGKGETEQKFGFVTGQTPEIQYGPGPSDFIKPTYVTGESKSLPTSLMGAFAVQPYENQMAMLGMVDPRLEAQARAAYPIDPTKGGVTPTLDIPELAGMLTNIRQPKPGMRPGTAEYPFTTPINMFTEMLGKFVNASDQQNVENIRRFGIGRTGEQWVTNKISADTYSLYKGIINETMQELYPQADEAQRQKLADLKFQFRELPSGMYQMRQKTAGMIMPNILPVSEEWLGGFIGNFEVMASTQKLFPQFAEQMGMAPEQGPLGPRTSRATQAWAEAFKLQAYRQDRAEGIVETPPGALTIGKEQAKNILDALSGKITNETPDEEVIDTLKSAIGGVMGKEALEQNKSLWFPGIQEAILSPETFTGITSVRNGEDVTKLTGTYGRAVRQLLNAEYEGSRDLISGRGSFNAYQTAITRTLTGRRAKSALRRIYGRENEMGFSARYEPLPGLELNEMYVPNQILEKVGVSPQELENIQGPIPMVAGRYPTLSRGMGVSGMRLVTESELNRRNLKVPTPPKGMRKGNPFVRDTVYVAEAFSRGQHGDWDRDLLFAMLGLKEGTRTVTETVNGVEQQREVRTWAPLRTPDIMRDIQKPMEERLAEYEKMMRVMEPYTSNLDVLKGAIRTMLDPNEGAWKESQKTSRLTKTGEVIPGMSMKEVQEYAYLTNITASAGKGRSYNARRFLEAALTAEGGRTEEEVTRGYDTSAYMFQQYLDILRKKEEGFTPIEQAIGTININQAGKLSAITDSGEETAFSGVTRGGQYDMGALALNAGYDPSLSNDYLALLFGQGKQGAEGISALLKDFDYTKTEGGKVVPDMEKLKVRAETLRDVANQTYGEGQMMGGKSPIASILTMSAIERARRNKEKWGTIQGATVPWLGEERTVAEVIKDPMYRKMRGFYQLLVRKQGEPSASVQREMAEGGDLPLNRLAQGLANKVLNVQEARAVAQAGASFVEGSIQTLASEGGLTLLQGPLQAHASEIYKASKIDDVTANKPLQQIATRSAFRKDILTEDSPLFGLGERAESELANLNVQRRRALGIHLGGRAEKSELQAQIGRVLVQGNPDFFTMVKGAGAAGKLTPMFTEVKSTTGARADAIKMRLAGKSTGDPTADDQADEQIREARAQTQFYEKAYTQTQQELKNAQEAWDADKSPENAARLKRAKDRSMAMAEQLAPAGKGELGPEDVTRNTWRKAIAEGRTEEPQSQALFINRETKEVIPATPEQFQRFNVDVEAATNTVSTTLGTAEKSGLLMQSVANLPQSIPSEGGVHRTQPFGISSKILPSHAQQYRAAATMMAEGLTGGLPLNLPPMSPEDQAIIDAATAQGIAGTPTMSQATGGGAAFNMGTGAPAGTPPAGTPPAGAPPGGGGNLPPTAGTGTPATSGAPGGGGRPPINRPSRRVVSDRLKKIYSRINALSDVRGTEDKLRIAVNKVLGRDLDMPLTETAISHAVEVNLEQVAANVGPEGMAQLTEMSSLQDKLETTLAQASGVLNPNTGVRGTVGRWMQGEEGRRFQNVASMGNYVTGWKNKRQQQMQVSAIHEVTSREDIQEMMATLKSMNIDITDPSALAAGITDPTERSQVYAAARQAEHGLAGIKKVEPMLKTAGDAVPPKEAAIVKNLSDILATFPGMRTKPMELEEKLETPLATQAGKLEKAFEKLISTTDELSKAQGKAKGKAQLAQEEAQAEYNVQEARYKRMALGGEVAGITARGTPKTPEEVGQVQKVAAEYRAAQEEETKAEEQLGEVQKPEAGRRITSAARQLLGGWGLFYMRHLATLGLSGFQQGYQQENQYYAQAQAMAGQALGGGVGLYQNPEVALASAQARAGLGLYGGIRRIQAELAPSPLGDIGSSIAQGVGVGLLGGYMAKPLATLFGGLGVTEAGISKAIPYVGAAVAATTLVANQWAKSTEPNAAPTLAANMVEYRRNPSLMNALTAGWNTGWMGIFNPAGEQQAEQYRMLAENYANPSHGTPGVNMPWAGLEQVLGKPGMAQFAQVLAQSKAIFPEGIAPETAYGVTAEFMGAGVSNVPLMREIASQRQLGINTTQLAASYQAMTVGGPAVPSEEMYQLQARLGNMTAGQRETIGAGLQYAQNMPYSQQFLRNVAGGLTRGELEKEYGQKKIFAGFQVDEKTGQLLMGPDNQFVAKYEPLDYTAEERQTLAVKKAAQYANRPLGTEMAQGWGSYYAGQQLGLNTTPVNLDQMAQMQEMTAAQRVAYNRQQQMNQLMTSAMQSMNIGTNLSQPVMSSLVNQMAPGGPGAMNFLSLLTNKDQQALAMAARAVGTERQRPELVSVDLNRQGIATGLPLYTTNMTGFQAEQVWGAGYAQGPGAQFRQGAVQGVETPFGTQYGMRALQWQMGQKQYEYSQQALGIQGRGIELQRQYMPQFWAIEDQQRQLGYRQQEYEFGRAFAGLALQGRQFGEQQALQYRGLALQASQFGEQQAFQTRQMGVARSQFQENIGLNIRGFQENKAYAQVQWAFQDQTRELQWGWRQQDFAESSRFMTGRERRLAERQMARDTTMYGIEGEQIAKEREHQKEGFKLQEEGFAQQKKHFAENQKLEQESMALQKKHFEENQKMQEESYALQKKHFDENQAFQAAGIAKQKEFFEERKKLEEELIAKQREYQLAQLDLTQRSYDLQKKQSEEMRQMEIDYQKVSQTQDDVVGKYQIASKFEFDFADTTLKALETTQEIYKLWQEMLTGLTGDTPGKAAGGPVEGGQAYRVGETQEEVFVPQTSGTVIPMAKLRNPWGDTIGSRAMGAANLQSAPQGLTLHLSIGNQYLGKFVLSTLEKELGV